MRFAGDFMDRFGICMEEDATIEDVPIVPALATDDLRKFRVCRTGSAVRASGTAVSDDCDDLISDLSDAGGWLDMQDASDGAPPLKRNVDAGAGGAHDGCHAPCTPPSGCCSCVRRRVSQSDASVYFSSTSLSLESRSGCCRWRE